MRPVVFRMEDEREHLPVRSRHHLFALDHRASLSGRATRISSKARIRLGGRCHTPWSYFDHPTSPPLIDHCDWRIVMSPPDPDAAFAVLREADPEVMDRDQLAELATTLKAHRAWIDSLQVRITRRQRALADEGRAEAPKDLLAREGGQSGRDARTADDREKVCTALPAFEGALAGGAVSAGHVDAIASAVRGLDHVTAAEFYANCNTLLDKATAQGVDTFAQTCRDLAREVAAVHAPGSDVSELERQRAASKIKRWTDRETGMRHTLISLDPVRDQIFWTAVSHSLHQVRRQPGHAKTPWAQLEVEGLIAACSSGGAGGGGGAAPVPLGALPPRRPGGGAHTPCETPNGTPPPAAGQ